MTRLPTILRSVVERSSLYPRLAGLHPDDALAVHGAVLGPEESDHVQDMRRVRAVTCDD